MADEKHNLITWLGFTTEPDFSKARLLGHAIGYGFAALYVCVFLLLVGGLMWTITHVPDIIGDVIYATDPTEARWLLASLAALTAVTSAAVALPFTVLKTIYNRRQTEVAEQSHITDQINKAVENLGATRDIHRQRRTKDGKRMYLKDPVGNIDYSKPVFETVTVPNLEVRIGGILALERIARNNLSEHIQVMKILSAFIRENVKQQVEANLTVDETEHPIDGRVKQAGKTTTPLRADIASAFDVLQNRSEKARAFERELSFRLDFQDVDFSRLILIGRDFSNANLRNAKFYKSRLIGAYLCNTVLEETNFAFASLDYADLSGAEIFKSKFHGAEINGTNFNGARITGHTFIEKTSPTLFSLSFQGASIRRLKIEKHDPILDYVDDVFGDERVELPHPHPRPAHWPSGPEIKDSLAFERAWRAWQDEIGFDRRTNRLKGHSD